MSIVSIDHIQLAMPKGQEGRARNFYCSLLGFKEIAKPDELQKNGGVWFKGGSVDLHIGVEEDFRPAKKAHPCFTVDDLSKIRDTLLQNKVETTAMEPLGKMERFFAFDCFGNRLEFTQERKVSNEIEDRLKELEITLPEAAAPAANYVPFTVSGNTVFISGQVPVLNGELPYRGKLGDNVSLEDGQAAARLCALNIIAQVKAACDGDLSRVVRCLKLGGFVNCTPDFGQHPAVVNGASDLMVDVFGDKGRHARFAVGAPALPFDVAVEVDAIFEIS